MSVFETAEFGNHNGSHQLLRSSLPSTIPVLEELRFLVDRPAGNIGSEVTWSPYWGCDSIDGWWVLWRGEEDLSAPRKNMVKARVVLVPIEQCASIESFDDLLTAVGYTVHEGETSDVLSLAVAVIDCLAREQEPAIIPNLPIAPLLIRAVWSKLWASARISLSLRTLFGVESLESSYQPRIVVIPAELRLRWRSYPLLDDKEVSTSGTVSQWFFGNDSPQLDKLLALNATKLPGDLSVLERLSRLILCLERLYSGTGTITDALLVVRTVEAFTQGLVLPKEDILVVASMLSNLRRASIGEVRTASLVRLDFFEDHTEFENALSRWVEARLPEQSINDALWILEHHAGTQHADWWRSSVGKGIAAGCKSMNQVWAKALWSWWSTCPDSLQQIKEHLPCDPECEKWICNYTPTQVDDELLTAVIRFCHEREWASLLARTLGTTRPLTRCVEILHHNLSKPESGLDTLLSTRHASEIVDVAAEISWEPLYLRASLLTVAAPQLLARVSDFKKLVPLLMHHLSANGEFPTALLTDTFLVRLFDAIVTDDNNCMSIAKHLGRGAGRHLLDHPEEEKLWRHLLPVVSADFIADAVDHWWKRFLNDEKTVRPADQLCESVLNSAHNKVRGTSITLVIGLLRLFSEISEERFKDWMNNEGFSWATGDHKRLADLLLKRKWSTATKNFRWSWKSELKLVAWHAHELLSWSDKFWSPPIGADSVYQYGDSSMAKGSMSSKKKMKILFLAANPMKSEKLALDEEFRSIKAKIRSAKHRDDVELSTDWAVRPTDLQQSLLEEEPTIVHFSGHGGGTIGLVMHSTSHSDESLVSSEALADLFRVLKNDIRVVVLNACYSEVQAKAIVEQIDFVVGMSESIGDEAARMFAASFYRGLSFGKSVKEAFELGKNELKLLEMREDEKIPILLVRSGTDAEKTTLVTAT